MVWRGGGGYTTFCMNVRISPSLFPIDPVLRCTWVQISPQNLTACTRQELCLSDDTTTRFGFFTIDVDVNGSRRTWCDDGLIIYLSPVNGLIIVFILCLHTRPSLFGMYRILPRVHYVLLILPKHEGVTSRISITSPLLQSLFLLRSVGPHTNARTRGQDTAALVLPTVHIGYGLRSVSFLAAGRWNTLPPNCRQAQSAGTFAHLTKIHLGFPVTRPCLLGLP